MSYKYQNELDTIVAARKADPNIGAKTLAKQLEADGSVSGRSFYSIYSVIRRYDDKQKGNKLAGVATKALAKV